MNVHVSVIILTWRMNRPLGCNDVNRVLWLTTLEVETVLNVLLVLKDTASCLHGVWLAKLVDSPQYLCVLCTHCTNCSSAGV